MLPRIFLKLNELFAKHGFHLYMVGGTSRDFLLKIDSSDIDLVTDATPEQMKAFLPEGDYHFEAFGCVRLRDGDGHIDITTLRKETGYSDHRHPDSIVFVTSLEEDSWRRDFTVNALYIDGDGHVYDFHNGLDDLKSKTIRFIGEPRRRIQEDPLRIVRAERFVARLGFSLEGESAKAIEELRGELAHIQPDKLLMERKKR